MFLVMFDMFSDVNSVVRDIQKVVGDDYKVQTRYELNELIFKTNKIETLTWTEVVLQFNCSLVGAVHS